MANKTSNKAAKRKPSTAARRAAVKRVAAKTARPRKTEGRPRSRKTAEPVLLSGGNPQIAKGYGDAPVPAYIAAMPGWKRDVGRRLDALVVRAVPGVRKAVKWNSPLYGIEGQGWFLGLHLRESRLGDWRGATLARVRTLIKQADPDVVEEWKWGVPVWSHAGIICTGETYKSAVKLTFARGASLEDPVRLFNSSLQGNTRRAIDFHQGDTIDEKALKALVRAAAAVNTAVRAATRPVRSRKKAKSD